MIEPNSTIKLLSNIPLNNSYADTIYFSNATQQLNYFNSKVSKTFEKLSYIRVSTNSVRIDSTPDALYNCNYLMFRNTSYGNKWFYAFVTNLTYVNDNCVQVEFEIDVIQTWWDEWELVPCFIERQHALNDTIGSNRNAEPLNCQNYVTNSFVESDVSPDSFKASFSEARRGKEDYVSPYTAYSGIGVPVRANIPVTLWEVTGKLTSLTNGSFSNYYQGYIDDGKSNDLCSVITFCSNKNQQNSVAYPTSLDGYMPKNKKLLQFPFVKITLSNLSGNNVELRCEDFDNYNNLTFETRSEHLNECQSFCYPLNYKGIQNNTDFGLLISNYPTLQVPSDSYATYMAQNKSGMIAGVVNNAVQMSSGLAATAIAGMTGNPLVAANLASNAVSSASGLIGQGVNIVASVASAKTLPDSVIGRAGGNVINCLLKNFKFRISVDTITSDIAKSFDDYLTRFGYAVNKIDMPNISGRPSFNYVKTVGCTITGAAPANARRIIESAFNRGITFWKSGKIVGDYSQENGV